MSSTQVMAFDLGASNGRAIVGEYEAGKIKLHELHRFSNDPVQLGNHMYWDFPKLFHELKTALIMAKNQGFKISSVGIDSWGVDYGLVDQDGDLINNPVHYRDERAARGMAMLLEKYSKESLKEMTGMDCVSYNTVNQLIADKFLGRGNIKALLNMPDLFNFFLTGNYASEYSMASTTQLFDYQSKAWNGALMDELGLDQKMFQNIVGSGTVIGDIKENLLNEMKIDPVKVIAVTSHDTASAIRAVPSDDEEFLFIATGTWIIVGSKQQAVTMNEQVMSYDLTNEGGKYPDVNLLKNHVGLWMLQEAKRHWEKEGKTIGFGEMVDLAEQVTIDAYVDIMDERFFEPGDMPLKVRTYCRETDQQIPESIGEVVRVIEQSLAKQIAETLAQIEEAAGKSYSKVYIFGGGVQDRLLCRLIGEFAAKEVVKGPKEATAFGNVVDQLIGLGVISEKERLEVLKASIG